jgi:hypothetical protein
VQAGKTKVFYWKKDEEAGQFLYALFSLPFACELSARSARGDTNPRLGTDTRGFICHATLRRGFQFKAITGKQIHFGAQ